MGLAENINKPEVNSLHTNAMARAAGADGSLTGDVGVSIEQRKEIDNNRSYVAKYTDSHIGKQYVPAALRRYKPRKASKLHVFERDVSPAAKRQQSNATPPVVVKPPTAGFREPPTRGFNPYK